MQSGASTFVMHCQDGRQAEALLHTGLTFRGQLVKLVAAPNTQWVKLTRVMYGTTENAIKSRLSDYGNVQKIRHELVQGIGISVYSVKMELRKPIPSRLTIANYPVNVFYRGQVQQCFRCEQTGHQSKDSPFKKSRGVPPAQIVGDTIVRPSTPTGAATTNPVGSVPAADENDTASADDGPPGSLVPPAQTMEVSETHEDTVSEGSSSTSTPVNPDTSKRQLSGTVEASPMASQTGQKYIENCKQ
jgi:hypothetical protein